MGWGWGSWLGLLSSIICQHPGVILKVRNAQGRMKEWLGIGIRLFYPLLVSEWDRKGA